MSIKTVSKSRSFQWETLLTLVIVNYFLINCIVIGVPIENIELRQFALRVETSTHCPKYFRFDNETRKCYRVGEKANCGRNMIFVDVDGAFGECDCDFQSSVRPLVYHAATDQCYPTFSKAFCGPRKWLLWTGNDVDTAEPKCVLDRCQDVFLLDPEASNIIVEFQGKCVSLHSRNSSCKSGEVVTFLPNELQPSCAKITDEFGIASRSVYKTKRLACQRGSRRDRTGKCRTVTVTAAPAFSFPDDK